MFTKGDPRIKPGRTKGSKNKKTTIEELLTAKVIDNAYKADFIAGDKFVRQHAYESYYGKPIQENKNTNSNSFSDGWELSFTKPKLAENK
jgi:hypothetical protein